jgi:hypothetical protein
VLRERWKAGWKRPCMALNVQRIAGYAPEREIKGLQCASAQAPSCRSAARSQESPRFPARR